MRPLGLKLRLQNLILCFNSPMNGIEFRLYVLVAVSWDLCAEFLLGVCTISGECELASPGQVVNVNICVRPLSLKR